MAAPITFMVFDENDVPKTDAAPAFTIYRTRGLVNLSPPLIFHRGGGVYVAQPTDADEQIGVVYSIDTGFYPDRIYGAVSSVLDPFMVIELVDENDILWVGALPTIGLYKDLLGTDRTPPAIVEIATHYLFTVTPSVADLVTGVILRVDAPADAFPSYKQNSFKLPAIPIGIGDSFNAGIN